MVAPAGASGEERQKIPKNACLKPMLKPVGKYFLKDQVVMDDWQFDPAWFRNRKVVYEVIRVMKGVPLFVSEHLDRLLQSAIQDGFPDVSQNTALPGFPGKLIMANGNHDGNILLCLAMENDKIHTLGWYINHRYPTPAEYESGVVLSGMKATRKNPGIKRWNAKLRKQAVLVMESRKVYEVLLIDPKGNITEGSRSNIFLGRGNTVFTPPAGRVLPGITRQKVIDICNSLLIRVTEQEIGQRELPFYEAAFLTGTSPGVLPVSMINNVRFNTANSIVRKLMDVYEGLVSTTISGK
jgi:branched-chain amino acid aminotransferase